MNTKWLTNPFFVYILSFLLVFLVYTLGWSDQYPPLDLSIKVFLFSTFVISFFLAFALEKARKNVFQPIAVQKHKMLIVGLIYFGYVLEFAYSGGVPLLQTIAGGYNYKDFKGIPTFHVILSTFNIFYSVYIFHQYQSAVKGKKLLLFWLITSILPHLLVLNRGAIMITLASWFFIYLMKMKHIKLKRIIVIPLALMGVIYLFGVIGNMRYSVSQEDKKFILRIGGASEAFIDGNVPAEYYWGYLYIATPIGNFQNIVTKQESKFDAGKLPFYMFSEPLPDFLSKKILAVLGIEEPVEDASNYLVIESLNAPTVYFRSYFLLGWIGAWLMYLHSAIIMLFYPFILKKSSRYYLTGWACLVTLVFLNIFSNMWYASGTILIWPLLLSIFENIRLKKNEATRT
ncbi:oligosaccharide repeat unit polymerase [Chitinophaga sp. Mgbs1]|uniref:Oligosaccharide repeat unit polymerase n=1 Tax=Chitinophaga solisilvae TaxID=1233460 RepID=A0A3S1DLD0_9BACT|nr:oligosaccharide repeat unit polymerase [Chitinophaga solisilvae]